MSDDYHNQLLSYVRHQLQQRVPNDHIYQTLTEAGWDPTMVNRALQELGATAIEQPAGADGQSADHPLHYTVFRAIGDAFAALKNNLSGALLSLLVCTVASFTLTFIMLSILVDSTVGSFTDFKTSLITLVIIMAIVGVVGAILISALELCLVSRAFYDGAEGRSSSLKQLIVSAKKHVLRVAGSSLLILATVGGPLIAISLLSLVLNWIDRSNAFITLISVFGFLAGVVWAVLAGFNFVLAPYVAVFESDVPLTKTLPRSRQLMQGGGRWFIFKGVLLIFVAYIVFITIFGSSDIESSHLGDRVVDVLSSILSTFFVGVLTMLYRNRVAVRGSQQSVSTHNTAPHNHPGNPVHPAA